MSLASRWLACKSEEERAAVLDQLDEPGPAVADREWLGARLQRIPESERESYLAAYFWFYPNHGELTELRARDDSLADRLYLAELYPDQPDRLLAVARAYLRNHSRARALEWLQRARGADEEARLTLEVLARSWLGQCPLDLAREAVRRFPDSPQLVAYHAALLEEAGEDPEAAYRAGVERFPADENLRCCRARWLHRRGRSEEAARELAEAMGLAPPPARRSRFELAGLFLALGQRGEALKLLEVLADDPEARCWRAQIYLDAQRPAEALALVREPASREEEALRVEAYRRLGSPAPPLAPPAPAPPRPVDEKARARALQHLEQGGWEGVLLALEACPDCPEAYLARAELRTNRIEQARDLARGLRSMLESTEPDPRGPEEQARDLAPALPPGIARMLLERPDTSWARGRHAETIGADLLELGRPAAALPLLHGVRKAVCLWRLGRKQEAQVALEEAERGSPARELDTWGHAYFELGHFDKAEREFARLCILFPRGDSWRWRGEAAAAAGMPGAEQHLRTAVRIELENPWCRVALARFLRRSERLEEAREVLVGDHPAVALEREVTTCGAM